MVKLNFFHACESAFLLKNNTPAIIGIFSVIQMEKLPFKHSGFSLITNFTTDDSKAHKINILLESPSKKKIFSTENNIQTQKDESVGFLIKTENLHFEEFGKYKFIISADGKKIAEEFIDIEKRN